MYYLAVDIGASSGRHILGHIENGKIVLEEVFRFDNGGVKRNGHLCWDAERLFFEIKEGLKRCAEIGKKPSVMGIDSFGVDFALIGKDGELIGDTVAYRDSRTEKMDEKVFSVISREELYAKTGIQNQPYNTIYQLCSLRGSGQLEKADRFLMLSEYFTYLLTGSMMNEYTNNTTTGLLNAQTREFDSQLLEILGIPGRLFGKSNLPGTSAGRIKKEIEQEIGYSLTVILPATHDTGSAVMAVPTEKECIFLSSGTWSLMGAMLESPVLTEAADRAGFTNEGAYGGKIRFLKNIMGLWLIQSIRHELGDSMSFDQMAEAAGKSNYKEKIDVNDLSFLAPESMIEAVKDYLKEHGKEEPKGIEDILFCVYSSLAASYGETVRELEVITGKEYDRIHIIGGGGKNTLLNRLTAQYTGKRVFAGPTEGSALGNIICQMIAMGELSDMKDATEIIKKSFEVKEVE